MLLALLLAATPITDAIRENLASQVPHPIASLQCPEGAEATKGEFECTGTMVDGQRFTVQLARQADGVIQPKLIHFHGPEHGVREMIRTRVPRELREFDCPDDPPQSDFECRGTTSDNTAFTVLASRKGDVYTTQSITYDGSSDSEFIRGVRGYVGAKSKLLDVYCHLYYEPECTARFANESRTIRVARQADGRLAVTAVVIPYTPNRALRGIGIALLIIGLATIITAVAFILRLREKLIVTRLPLAAEQVVRFDSPDGYVLHIEGPQFTTAFAGLKYTLIENATGQETTSLPIIFRSTTSGFSTAKMSIRRFFVQNAGDHTLRVDGIRAESLKPSMSVFFSRPWPVAGYGWMAVAAAGGLMCFAGLFATIAG
jgi:hypothetical protein